MEVIHIHDKIILLKKQIEKIDENISYYQKSFEIEKLTTKISEIKQYITQLENNRKIIYLEYKNLEEEYKNISKNEDMLYKEIYKTLDKISKNKTNEVYDFNGKKVDN